MLYDTNALLVGGESTYATQFKFKAIKHGININVAHHIDWDQTRKSFPTTGVDVVIVLKDVCNHMLRDWASAEARKNNLPFCEISQKISFGIARLRQTLGIDSKTNVSSVEDEGDHAFVPSNETSESLHEVLEGYTEVLVPKSKAVLASKKKYLTYLSRTLVKLCKQEVSEFNESRSIAYKDIAFHDYGVLREEYASALKLKKRGYVEIEELARSVIILMTLDDRWTIFDIKRTLSFALGYSLTKKQEQEIKDMKTDRTSLPLELKPIVSEILENPTQTLGFCRTSEERLDMLNAYLSYRLNTQISKSRFETIMGVLQETSRDRKNLKADLKQKLISARDTWARHYLELIQLGMLDVSKSEFNKVHKLTWGSRVSDAVRKEMSDNSHTEAPTQKTTQEEIAPVVEAPVVEAEAPVVETPVMEAEAPVVETPVMEAEAPVMEAPVTLQEVAQSLATVLIGDLELEIEGALSIKEVAVGTQIKVLSGQKKITIESFDGSVLKGVVIS
jgi:hypothetical protein